MVLEEKKELSPSHISLSIYKNICFIHIKFRFFIRKKLQVIYEGEQLLMHLVRPTTKEEKNMQYNSDTHDTILFKINDQWECVHE